MSLLRPEVGTDDTWVPAAHDVVPDAEGLRAAREFVRQTVRRWVSDLRVANAALDVAHELVSNAARHAAPPIRLTLLRESSAILITVTDGSPEPARRLPYRSGVSERGLGLRLVGQLSHEWGQRQEPDGKAVWARVHSGPRRSRTP
jgi:two-component sensor histidine kinase